MEGNKRVPRTHTHTNTRIHISSTQSINRQVLELKLEETLQRKKLKKAATTTTSNETSKHRIKLHASNKYGLFFTSSFDVRFSRCIALYFFFLSSSTVETSVSRMSWLFVLLPIFFFSFSTSSFLLLGLSQFQWLFNILQACLCKSRESDRD